MIIAFVFNVFLIFSAGGDGENEPNTKPNEANTNPFSGRDLLAW